MFSKNFSASCRRLPVFLLVFGLLLLALGHPAFAQQRANPDSAARARQALLEQTRAAQKRALDSARASRQRIMDSINVVRKHRTDSLARIRKYRESRRFRDSVTAERQEKIEVMREALHARLDSMKEVRQRATDSAIAAREAALAPIRKAQQRRIDSLAAIRKYKASKRYADSVAIAQKARAQEIADRRKAVTDSLTAVRKANLDKLKAARKVITDSLAAVRKVRTDSLNARSKERAAQLAKTKENQLRDKKIKEKQAENKAQIAFELKIKKKRSTYNNENMLKKKWSAPRRAVQNTFTHYNYYFNAERKMAEAEANMQRTARDKWDERIDLFTFIPARDSTTFSADMDSVIQKTSLGIQIHDPRTKWGDDLYLLLGKAYFYKGDLENASASFKYIVALQEKAKAEAAKRGAYSNKTVRGKKEAPSFVTPEQKGLAAVLKREPAVNDGLLWLAHSYTAFGYLGEAESVLDLLSADAKFPENMRGKLALEKSFLALKQHNDKDAAANLVIAAGDKSIDDFTRRRAAFLAGQILQESGSYQEAARQYAIVTDLHPKIDMDFAARSNRAYALMQAGGIQKDAIASLKDMLNDGKYAPFYEQVYYVLGRLSANAGRNDEAIAYLQKGLGSSKTTRKQKALSFAALGNIYFATGAYQEAKLAYDSLSRFAPAAPDDSAVAIAMRRAPLVDKIALPAYIVHQQDSLLALGALTDKDRRAAVRKYIKYLQARKADSAFRAENGGVAAATVTDNSATNGGNLTASSWYFANPAQMQQGITDFKRKWGNRPQADNWRRQAAIASAGTGSTPTASNDGGDGAGDAANDVDESGLPTEEALLAIIPTTAEARAVANARMQRSMVDLATAYVRQFEDYARATATLDSFDKRWTLNPYTAEATYLRYLIALRKNDLKDAQRWSNKLQSDFPGTQWANYVAPAPNETKDNGPILASVGDYYDETYDLLQQRQYGEVLNRTRAARRNFSNESYSNRFRIVEAMAYAGSADYNKADTILNDFIKNNGTDPLKPWAEQVLTYVTERRKADTLVRKPNDLGSALPADLAATAANSAINKPVDSFTRKPIDTSSLPIPSEYTYKAADPHYFVFAFNKMEPRAMAVKAGLADLNRFRYSQANLEAEVIPMKAGKGLIIVKTFKSAAAARTYLSSFTDVKMLVREFNATEYQTFVISASNYRKLVSDGSVGSYLPFYRSHY